MIYMKKSCYLAGPIDRCPNFGINWRKDLSKILVNLDLSVNDPLLKSTEKGNEDIESRKLRNHCKKTKDYNLLSKIMKEIRNEDLKLVKKSDIVIANIDTKIYTCGTLEELFLAKRLGKKIFIRVKQGKINTPDWLFGVLDHNFIFSNWVDLVEFIKKELGLTEGKDKVKLESSTGEKNVKRKRIRNKMYDKYGRKTV